MVGVAIVSKAPGGCSHRGHERGEVEESAAPLVTQVRLGLLGARLEGIAPREHQAQLVRLEARLERAQQSVVPQERGDRRALSHRVIAAAVPARGVDHVLTQRKDIGALPVQ
eukprot:scaffold64685_cov63-Phaeocystis_antarctica.AAC.1